VSKPAVDVHAHVDVPAVAALVAGQAGLAAEQASLLATFGPESTALNVALATTTYRPMLDDLDVRLGLMDAGRVDVQAVSVIPTLYHYWADTALATDVVAACNEAIVQVCRERPDRFVGLAAASLQHPGLAAEQLRTATAAGLRGVEISTAVAGRDLSDRSLDPFWAAAEELGSLVFVHPWGCSLGSRLSIGYLGNVVGNPTETTVALHHLVFGGVFDRFPDLRVCAAHGGGYFPHYLARAEHAYRTRADSRTMQRSPREYLDRLWFDSLVYETAELDRLVQAVGSGHVVLGSDYPFDMGVPDPVDRVDALGLDPADRDAVVGETAAGLLGLDRAALTPPR
jgi:predicted TIM-barrel fold metal-dependent hydrolase